MQLENNGYNFINSKIFNFNYPPDINDILPIINKLFSSEINNK